jgi:hypothetical protein
VALVVTGSVVTVAVADVGWSVTDPLAATLVPSGMVTVCSAFTVPGSAATGNVAKAQMSAVARIV